MFYRRILKTRAGDIAITRRHHPIIAPCNIERSEKWVDARCASTHFSLTIMNYTPICNQINPS
jgi:hypothetical protein